VIWSPSAAGFSIERMVAVRAYPTIGARLGKGHISVCVVKPSARRSGQTISSALQIVGVS
jgi:hypothetical protein